MRIIDLLNKIANGEKVPQKIEYLDSVYELNEESFYMNNGDFFVDHINIDLSNLNDEIELIEDEEIDINSIKEFEIDENNFIQTDLGAFKTRKMDIAFLNKINELAKAVKQLDKRTRKEKE